jgi:tetratricopeptide (TPR) repeat protein
MSKTKIILITAIVAVVLIVGAVALILINKPTEAVPTAASHISLAENYLLDLNYEAAIAEYRAAIEIDPKNADYYIALAKVYVEIDDIDEAIAVLEEGLINVEKPDDDRIRIVLDELNRNTPDYETTVTAMTTTESTKASLVTEAAGPGSQITWFTDGDFSCDFTLINSYNGISQTYTGSASKDGSDVNMIQVYTVGDMSVPQHYIYYNNTYTLLMDDRKIAYVMSNYNYEELGFYLLDYSDLEKTSSGTGDVDGKTLPYDIYSVSGVEGVAETNVKFYYDGEAVYAIEVEPQPGYTSTMIVSNVKDDLPEGAFDIPKGYEIIRN